MFTVIDDDGNESLVEEPSAEKVHTYADYLTWQFEERVELFKGKVFKIEMPNTNHQLTLGSIAVQFANFLQDRDGEVFFAPFDVRIPMQDHRTNDDEIITVVQPDLLVVNDPHKIDFRGCCGVPDLAVEILLPGNSRKEVRLKYELYEEAGVKEYWIVNPDEENLIVFHLEAGVFGGGRMYASGDIIQVKTIPGLSFDVQKIFARKWYPKV